jgi:hypothetical protein
MKRLFFASGLILLSACNESTQYSSPKNELTKLTLRTLNSKNDVQICYDPINCLLMPENFDQSALDLINAQNERLENKSGGRAPASVGPAPSPSRLEKLSPMMAAKVEELSILAKKPLTVDAVYINPADDKKDARTQEGLDFQIAGLKPEELKSFCERTAANAIRIYSNYIHCDWLTAPVSTELQPQAISLHVNGELKKGESVSVNVDSFDKAAGSELLVEWNVKFAGRKLMTSSSSTLTLENLKAGYYQVTAQVGGMQEENISLIVE